MSKKHLKSVSERQIIQAMQFSSEARRWASRVPLDEDTTLSVVAGEFLYSSPRQVLSDPADYNQYEFAILIPQGFFDLSRFSDFGGSIETQVGSYRDLAEIVKFANQYLNDDYGPKIVSEDEEDSEGGSDA